MHSTTAVLEAVRFFLLLCCAAVCVTAAEDTDTIVDGQSISVPGEEGTVNVDQTRVIDEEFINEQLPKDVFDSFFEGDIVLTPEQKELLEKADLEDGEHQQKRAVVRFNSDKWPNGVVPYELDSSLGSRARRGIDQAIAEYDRQTCVRFRPRNRERDYVRFFVGRGCYSAIGRSGGRQDISIGSGCESVGVVMHEMFHALGRWHEQSRPDRDTYIRINTENIQRGLESQFRIVSTHIATTNNIRYDIQSIMHYSAFTFSRNGRPTIEPLPASGVSNVRDVGRRDRFTFLDVDHVNELYNCDSNPISTGTWSSWGLWGSCSRTCGGGTQTRRRSCNGGSCSGSSTQTRSCNTNTCSSVGSWGSWGSWGSCSRTCNGGTQIRRRSCNGGSCSGSNSQTRSCNTNTCSSVGSWGSWGSWGSCSRTCNGGTQFRRRSCNGGSRCSGSRFDIRRCNTDACSSWGSWGSWNPCSATCGGGSQTRSRRCQGSGCPGSSLQSRSCNTDSCPVSSSWGSWGSWSSCSATCGGGSQTRTRTCQGSGCAGSSSQQRNCNANSCPQPGGSGWGSWSEWTCRGRVFIYRIRSRVCLGPSCLGSRNEIEICNDEKPECAEFCASVTESPELAFDSGASDNGRGRFNPDSNARGGTTSIATLPLLVLLLLTLLVV